MLHERGVYIEPKPFSIGVRIEHPQSWIDRARFGAECRQRNPRRGEYHAISHHCEQRPHGLQLLHVPGRHRGRRDVGGGPRRHQRDEPIFAQRAQRQFGDRRRDRSRARLSRRSARRDRAAAALGGWPMSPAAPTTRRRPRNWATSWRRPSTDAWRSHPFLSPRRDDDRPCRVFSRNSRWTAMREALPAFGRQIPGYDHPDAVMTGVETRTSSPIRFTRGEDFQSLNTAGLFRPARARVMPAASSRRRSTGSRWPRRWGSASWVRTGARAPCRDGGMTPRVVRPSRSAIESN
jgi:hypothetical protein